MEQKKLDEKEYPKPSDNEEFDDGNVKEESEYLQLNNPNPLKVGVGSLGNPRKPYKF
jgi:hypothetical protein